MLHWHATVADYHIVGLFLFVYSTKCQEIFVVVMVFFSSQPCQSIRCSQLGVKVSVGILTLVCNKQSHLKLQINKERHSCVISDSDT